VVRAASGSAMLRPRGGSGVPCARAEKELPCPLLQACAPKRCRLRNELRSPRAGAPRQPPTGTQGRFGPKTCARRTAPRSDGRQALRPALSYVPTLPGPGKAAWQGIARRSQPPKKTQPRDACARRRAAEHRPHSSSPEIEILLRSAPCKAAESAAPLQRWRQRQRRRPGRCAGRRPDECPLLQQVKGTPMQQLAVGRSSKGAAAAPPRSTRLTLPSRTAQAQVTSLTLPPSPAPALSPHVAVSPLSLAAISRRGCKAHGVKQTGHDQASDALAGCARRAAGAQTLGRQDRPLPARQAHRSGHTRSHASHHWAVSPSPHWAVRPSPVTVITQYRAWRCRPYSR